MLKQKGLQILVTGKQQIQHRAKWLLYDGIGKSKAKFLVKRTN